MQCKHIVAFQAWPDAVTYVWIIQLSIYHRSWCACYVVVRPFLCPGESGGGLSSRSFFNVRVELTEEGNSRVPEVIEVLFKYLDLVRAPGGINEQVKPWNHGQLGRLHGGLLLPSGCLLFTAVVLPSMHRWSALVVLINLDIHEATLIFMKHAVVIGGLFSYPAAAGDACNCMFNRQL